MAELWRVVLGIFFWFLLFWVAIYAVRNLHRPGKFAERLQRVVQDSPGL